MKKNAFTRRKFIQTTGAVTAGALLSPVTSCTGTAYDAKNIPTVMLGKTGVRIPKIIMGLGSRFMAVDEDKGLEILETGLSNGLYYWDTAASYGSEKEWSEERIGKILKNVRDQIFLSSKVEQRKGEDAKRTIETSLKRLQTDRIDLYQIHSVNNEEEVKHFGDKDGVLPVLKKYQEEGVIRFIGFSGHASAPAMKLAAEMYDFDTMLIALNHQERGRQPFEEQPVPYAAAKGMGVLAMKVIRPRETVEWLNPDDLVRYALSLEGITAAVIGMDSLEVLNRNVEIVQSFKPLDQNEMDKLRADLDPFYRNHKLPWMQPGYHDGYHFA